MASNGRSTNERWTVPHCLCFDCGPLTVIVNACQSSIQSFSASDCHVGASGYQTISSCPRFIIGMLCNRAHSFCFALQKPSKVQSLIVEGSMYLSPCHFIPTFGCTACQSRVNSALSFHSTPSPQPSSKCLSFFAVVTVLVVWSVRPLACSLHHNE